MVGEGVPVVGEGERRKRGRESEKERERGVCMAVSRQGEKTYLGRP